MKQWLLSFHFPYSRFLIIGNSMTPTFDTDQEVLVFHWAYIFASPQENDIIIVTSPKDGRRLIKRIKEVKNGKYFVVGDNENASTDSREFGWVERERIIGKVIRKI